MAAFYPPGRGRGHQHPVDGGPGAARPATRSPQRGQCGSLRRLRPPLPSRLVLEARAGGIYGWWGTTYAWHPEGKTLVYARPDQVGLVDVVNKKLDPWMRFVPYQAQGDWAWVPGVSWSPQGDILFTVLHGRPGQEVAEDDPYFAVVALAPHYWEGPVVLAENVGMFAFPVASPVRTLPTGLPLSFDVDGPGRVQQARVVPRGRRAGIAAPTGALVPRGDSPYRGRSGHGAGLAVGL